MTQRYEDFRKNETPIPVCQLHHQGLVIMPRIYKDEPVVQNSYLHVKSSNIMHWALEQPLATWSNLIET